LEEEGIGFWFLVAGSWFVYAVNGAA